MKIKDFDKLIKEAISERIKTDIVNESIEKYMVKTEDGIPLESFDSQQEADNFKSEKEKENPKQKLLIDKKSYNSYDEMLEELDEINDKLEKNDTLNMENKNNRGNSDFMRTESVQLLAKLASTKNKNASNKLMKLTESSRNGTVKLSNVIRVLDEHKLYNLKGKISLRENIGDMNMDEDMYEQEDEGFFNFDEYYKDDEPTSSFDDGGLDDEDDDDDDMKSLPSKTRKPKDDFDDFTPDEFEDIRSANRMDFMGDDDDEEDYEGLGIGGELDEGGDMEFPDDASDVYKDDMNEDNLNEFGPVGPEDRMNTDDVAQFIVSKYMPIGGNSMSDLMNELNKRNLGLNGAIEQYANMFNIPSEIMNKHVNSDMWNESLSYSIHKYVIRYEDEYNLNDLEEMNMEDMGMEEMGMEEMELGMGEKGSEYMGTDESEYTEEKGMCSECGSMLNEDGSCSECATKMEGSDMMYESKKKKLRLTESELVKLISNIVNESVPGLTVTNKNRKTSGSDSKKHMKDVESKMKKTRKFDGNDNPKFPKQIGKGEKVAKQNTKEENEIMSTYRGGGLEDLKYDTEPSKSFNDRLKKSLVGDSKMGNSQDSPNVVKTETGENIHKKATKKKEAIEKETKVGFGARTKEPLDVKVVKESKEDVPNHLMEEIKRMKNIASYNKKTQ